MHTLRLAAVLIAFALHATVSGQGTFQSLPDPISTDDLDRHAATLGLSEEQRLAVDPLHAQYRANFRALRDGAIEEYLEMAGSYGLMSRLFDPEGPSIIRDTIRERERVVSRIASLDRQLFDSIGTLLSEAQLADLGRAKATRQRHRDRTLANSAGLHTLMPGPDIARLCADLKLSDEQRAAIDDELERYERRATSLLGALVDAQVDTLIGIADVARDRENFSERLDEAWGNVAKESVDVLDDLSKLDRSTIDALMTSLPPEDARRIERRYFERRYWQLSHHGSADTIIKSALEKAEDDDVRAAVEGIRDTLMRTRHELLERGATLIDEQQFSTSPFTNNWMHDNEDINAVSTKIGEADSRAVEQVQRLVGADVTPAGDAASSFAIEAFDGGLVGGNFVVALDATAGGDFTTIVGGGASSPERHKPLPSAISDADLVRWSPRLDLDELQVELLDALHADYADQYASVIRANEEEAREAREARAAGSPNMRTDFMVFGMGSHDESSERRHRETLKSLITVDDAFFDQILVAVIDPAAANALKRCRLERRRFVYNREPGQGGMGGFMYFSPGGMGGSSEHAVDVTSLVDTLDLDDEARAAIDPALVDYESDAADAFQNRYETLRQVSVENSQMMSDAIRVEVDEDGASMISMHHSETFADDMKSLGERRQRATRGVVSVNRASLDSIMSLLPAADAEALRRAYERVAFPGVFADGDALEDTIRKSMELESLASAQRTRLAELASSYHAAYDEICRDMIDITKERGDAGHIQSFDPSTFENAQKFEQKMERLRFDRNELNAASKRQLRSILSDTQAAQVGLGEE